jgi:hypothetical protein
VAEALLPRARVKVGLQTRHATSDCVLIDERKSRNLRPNQWIEVRLRSTPKCGEESIDAVMRYRHVVNGAVPDMVHELCDGRAPRLIQSDNLRQLHFREPKVREVCWFDGE